MGLLDDQTDAAFQARYDAAESAYLARVPEANIPMIVYFAISSHGLANLTGSGLDGMMRCSIGTRAKALELALADLDG